MNEILSQSFRDSDASSVDLQKGLPSSSSIHSMSGLSDDSIPGSARSLCAHPKASRSSHTVDVTLNAEISEQIASCVSQRLPVVSFHSPLGHKACKNLWNANEHLPPSRPARVPSLLHHVLQAKAEAQLLEVEINGVLYQVDILPDQFEILEQTDSPAAIQGRLTLSPKNPTNHSIIELPFIEFAPAFDGYSLSSDDLLGCHRLLQQFRQTYCQGPGSTPSASLPDGWVGQFASAKGICRAASLLVLDQFAEQLSKVTTRSSFDSDQAFQELIHVARIQSGQPNLIPHQLQIQELKKSCEQLVELKFSQARVPDPESTPFPASENTNQSQNQKSQSQSEQTNPQSESATESDFIQYFTASPNQAADIESFNAILSVGGVGSMQSADYFEQLHARYLADTHLHLEISGAGNQCWARVGMLSMLLQSSDGEQLVNRGIEIQAIRADEQGSTGFRGEPFYFMHEQLHLDPARFLFGSASYHPDRPANLLTYAYASEFDFLRQHYPDSQRLAHLKDRYLQGSNDALTRSGYSSEAGLLLLGFASGAHGRDNPRLINRLDAVYQASDPVVEEDILVHAHRVARLPSLVISKSDEGGVTLMGNAVEPMDQDRFSLLAQQVNQSMMDNGIVDLNLLEPVFEWFSDKPILVIQTNHYHLYMPRSHSVSQQLEQSASIDQSQLFSSAAALNQRQRASRGAHWLQPLTHPQVEGDFWIGSQLPMVGRAMNAALASLFRQHQSDPNLELVEIMEAGARTGRSYSSRLGFLDQLAGHLSQTDLQAEGTSEFQLQDVERTVEQSNRAVQFVKGMISYQREGENYLLPVTSIRVPNGNGVRFSQRLNDLRDVCAISSNSFFIGQHPEFSPAMLAFYQQAIRLKQAGQLGSKEEIAQFTLNIEQFDGPQMSWLNSRP